MKLIDRYEFANGKAFETYYLDANDTFLNKVPECDVIGLRTNNEKGEQLRFTMMRPDEALILARMLIDAVRKVSEGYQVSPPKKDEGWLTHYRERMRELGVNAVIGEDLTERASDAL